MAREKGSGNLQQEKSGRWTIRVCVNGQRFSKTTRTKNQALAEVELRRFVAEHGGPADSLPFGESWSAYLASPNRRDLRLATLEGKKQVWSHFLSWVEANYPGTCEIREVTADMVQHFLSHLRSDHAATTYNNRVCVLREMFRVLKDKAGMVENPWEGVRLKSDDSHIRRALSVKEVARLIDCAGRVGEEWQKLFQVGIYTGLRLGDCCRLDWKTIDLAHGIIQLIPRKTAKFAHGRPITIPIHPALSAVLTATPEDDRVGPVMPLVSEMYLESRPAVGYRLKKIFKAAGITTSILVEGRKWKAPEATFHSLRHTFVSLAANAGVPLHIVQSIVGHESSAMTRHYYHENEDALRKAVAAIPSLHCADVAVTMPKPTTQPTMADQSQVQSTASAFQDISQISPDMMNDLRRIYSVLENIFGKRE